MQRLHINQQNPNHKPQHRRSAGADRTERRNRSGRRQRQTHQRSQNTHNMAGHENPTYIAAGGADGRRFAISSRAAGIMS